MGDLNAIGVEEVQAGHGKLRSRLPWLFFDGENFACGIDFHDTVTFGIAYCVAEDRRAAGVAGRTCQGGSKALAIKDVVTEYQSGWMARNYLTVEEGDVASLPVTSQGESPAIISATQYVPLDEVVAQVLYDVNMRSEPEIPEPTLFGEQDNIIRVLPAGLEVSARAVTFDGMWVLVQDGGDYRGWVRGQYLNVVSGTFPDLARMVFDSRYGLVVDEDGIGFAAEDLVMNPGGCTNIRWVVNGDGSVFYKARPTVHFGTRRECPTQTTRYSLTVVRPGNVTQTRHVTVAVLESSYEFTALSTLIAPNTCTTLQWESVLMRNLFLDGEEVAESGTREVCPGATTTYMMRGLTLDRQLVDKELTIVVDPNAPPPPVEPGVTYYADRTVINAGECVMINWSVQGAREIYYQGLGVTATGTRQECPTTTMPYVLRVFTLDNQLIEQAIVITVN